MSAAVSPWCAAADPAAGIAAAACRWGDAAVLAAAGTISCPGLEVAPLARDTIELLKDHREFKRCRDRAMARLRAQPVSDDATRQVLCAMLARPREGATPIMRPRE